MSGISAKILSYYEASDVRVCLSPYPVDLENARELKIRGLRRRKHDDIGTGGSDSINIGTWISQSHFDYIFKLL